MICISREKSTSLTAVQCHTISNFIAFYHPNLQTGYALKQPGCLSEHSPSRVLLPPDQHCLNTTF